MKLSNSRAPLGALRLLFLTLLTPSLASGAPQYHVVDLGTLGGATSANGITNSGRVVGTSHLPGNPDPRAFRTAANSVINPATDDVGELPNPINDVGSTGNAMNASGQVVGEDEAGAYRTTPNGTISTSSSLGALPGTNSSSAFAINNLGQVVGDSLGPAFLHAYRTTANGKISGASDLGTLGGTLVSARGINSSGQAVGISTTAASPTTNFHAFRTAPNAVINAATDDLGSLGGATAFARAINDSGRVVGNSSTISGAQHAFLTAPQAAINPLTDDLGTLGGATSDAYAVNGNGWVVGYSLLSTTAQAAFLFDGVSMTDLNTDSDALALGWQLTIARGINDSGQIVGDGTIGGVTHAFRLDPVPEPSTLILAAAGTAGLCRPRLRKER